MLTPAHAPTRTHSILVIDMLYTLYNAIVPSAASLAPVTFHVRHFSDYSCAAESARSQPNFMQMPCAVPYCCPQVSAKAAAIKANNKVGLMQLRYCMLGAELNTPNLAAQHMMRYDLHPCQHSTGVFQLSLTPAP